MKKEQGTGKSKVVMTFSKKSIDVVIKELEKAKSFKNRCSKYE